MIKKDHYSTLKHIFFIVILSILIPNRLNSEVKKAENTQEKEKELCERLYRALKYQNIDEMRALADQKCINRCIRKNDENKSLLHEACKEDYGNYPAIVKLLLERGMSVNIRDNNGRTPLHIAALDGNQSIAKILIAHGADINARTDNNGATPLHYIADDIWHYKKYDTAELLISHGADVNARTNDGDTPLHEASFWKNVTFAELLISQGANVNAQSNNGDTPLHKTGGREIIKKLLEHGANVHAKNLKGATPLHKAAWLNSTKAIDILILNGADINAQKNNGNTPLLHTAHTASKEMITKLLGHGANIHTRNLHGETVLHRAVHPTYSYTSFYKNKAFLFSKDAVINIGTLFSHGADINAQTKDGNTPLHLAAQFNNHRAVKKLLELGANPRIKNNQGKTALQIAREVNENRCDDNKESIYLLETFFLWRIFEPLADKILYKLGYRDTK